MKSPAPGAVGGLAPSPPSRGAWIEMPILRNHRSSLVVAPLAGGVD